MLKFPPDVAVKVIHFVVVASFYTNPQYHVTLSDIDDDDDDNMCTVVVALMQKHRRLLKRQGGANLTIGYEIYQVQGRNLTDGAVQIAGNIKYWAQNLG